LRIDDVRVTAKPLVLATSAEVDALASGLWITFPGGYREYVTRLGEGVLGSFVRIYPPWRIERELTEWRRRISKYWFWDKGRALLPKERALECVLIGDTVNGDELVFHPTRANKLFILPRDSDQIFEAGDDLLSAVEWICTSGELVEGIDERSFEPFDSRIEEAQREDRGTVADPEGESLDEIVELATRWAARHSAKKLGAKEMKSRVPKGSKVELLYEGIIIEGRSGLEAGYGIGWKITDKESGREVGIFWWNKSEGSSGSAFEPAKGG
jgi:hypothetical protein